MTRWRGPVFAALFLASSGAATAGPQPEQRLASPQRFHLFPAPPASAAAQSLAGIGAAAPESLVRLPGDPDSLFSLGGPGPSGRPRVRIAVEVNEAIPKLLAPDPKVESTDFRGRPGGDWKPIDSAGRPYQLRFGARLIW